VIAPRNLDAERAVLGAALVSGRALALLAPMLDAEDFYSETHRRVWGAVKAAARDHEEVDRVLLRRYLADPVADDAFVVDLLDSVPTASNALKYAEAVREAAVARRVMDAADRIKQLCASPRYADAAGYAMQQLQGVVAESNDEGAKPIADAAGSLAELVRSRREGKGITGIATGISWMDRGLHGLNPGCSYIIAARPGVGKSLVIGQIAANAVYAGYRVLLQTPEMSRMQYLDRLAHGAARVDYERAQEGRITDEEEAAINGWARTFAEFPLFVDDYGTQTVGRVRANVVRYKPDLLLVDYVQYMTPDDRSVNRNQQVGQISRDLTRIKSDFGIPVVMAAQLNRDIKDKKDKRPELWDLRDSGELEQDADAVIMLHREGRYDPQVPDDEIEFLCRKFRNGSLWYKKMYLAPGSNWVVANRGEEAAA
jgi:replicative DNA helicase